MDDSDTLQRAGWERRSAGPVFDIAATKLHSPRPRPGTVHRPSLIDWLARDDSRPIVSVVAPPGYPVQGPEASR